MLTFRKSERGRTGREGRLREVEWVLADAERALDIEVALRRDAESEIARLKAQIADLRTTREEGRTKQGP